MTNLKSSIRISHKIISFLWLIFFLCSCKTDKGILPISNNTSSISYTQFLLNKIPDENRVHPAEVTEWLGHNLSSRIISTLKIKNSQQNVMQGKHVIRIPVLDDFTVFFTKDKGELLVYAYKHLDKAPGQKLYTGSILEYSFKLQSLKEEILDKGKHTFTGYLYITPEGFNVNRKEVAFMPGTTATIKTETLWNLMLNGQWLDSTTAGLGMGYGAEGLPGKIKHSF